MYKTRKLRSSLVSDDAAWRFVVVDGSLKKVNRQLVREAIDAAMKFRKKQQERRTVETNVDNLPV